MLGNAGLLYPPIKLSFSFGQRIDWKEARLEMGTLVKRDENLDEDRNCGNVHS